MEDWLDSLKAGGLSEETIRCRRYKLGYIARRVGEPPETVTAEQLTRWMAAQEWKVETRRAYRKTLVSFFRWMQRTGRRADNPADDLPKVRKAAPKPRPCPDRYILDALRRATGPERLMVRLAAECGLRRGEIARVHSRDVMDDLLGRSLIVTGKGDKQRIVPLPDDLADLIQAAGGYLFPGRWSGHVEQSYVNRHVSGLLPDGWGCHSLRHRYATKTYEQTHDLFLVAKLLGHSSVETTQIYVAMPDSHLRAAMAAVTLQA
ncbi:tyrosine-type recombinase/integrase [Bifidobacterium biavatii]|uniref:Site-specific recombinase, phage integrase family n=1 Tax=Bifidobacterium biavatii DSM 23969 TaxID=1437608 RepID=A0A087A1J0_9BIFI|nr:tyrosine-type recombinase/integrase [Bifidobacterium biavatii]KFI52640.1 site-specific recombinase, phage integrase family [Bifidobacterium biavatii DSM 23969]